MEEGKGENNQERRNGGEGGRGGEEECEMETGCGVMIAAGNQCFLKPRAAARGRQACR